MTLVLSWFEKLNHKGHKGYAKSTKGYTNDTYSIQRIYKGFENYYKYQSCIVEPETTEIYKTAVTAS